MARSRVVLADDHEAMLDQMARLIAPEFEVVALARDGWAALAATERCRPDVVVLDISMPILTGLEAARLLRERGCTSRIVFVTVHDDADYVSAGLAAGAMGYVVKARLASDLPSALRAVMNGARYITSGLLPGGG